MIDEHEPISSRGVSEPARLKAEREALAAAQSGDGRAFEDLVAPHRGGIHLHCYRMLGEVHDADDALQESLLRAWRALAGFEPRAPVRTWLYRIATNVCLTALARRRQRGLLTPGRLPDPRATGLEQTGTQFGPYPDRLLRDSPGHVEPDAQVELDESIELAFVAAVQLLPARQRAVLLMRDVLDFSAREVAVLLGTSVAAVNSSLQRARSTVERERRAGQIAHPHAPASRDVERELTRRLADAWRAADVEGIVRLLADDGHLTTPPEPLRVVGRKAVGAFLAEVPAAGRLERFHFIETGANRQPALAAYVDDPATGAAQAHALLVLSIRDREIASLCRFADLRLFERLELPSTLPADNGASSEALGLVMAAGGGLSYGNPLERGRDSNPRSA